MFLDLPKSSPLNLDFTLCCGQSFRWHKHGEWWYGIVKDTPFKIRQVHHQLEFKGVQPDLVTQYFGLTDNLQNIFSEISKDQYIQKAITTFSGLRILRQDPWECLMSFICATFKNIPAIQKMILNLSKKFGEKKVFEGYNFYTFPTPNQLIKANLTSLKQCGLGYRAKFVYETARLVHHNDFNFTKLLEKSFDNIRKQLLSLPGVGFKVADCVLLFSLGKCEAFPVDVWIKRIILKYYSAFFPQASINKMSTKRSLNSLEYKTLSSFGQQYFGKYAGYAQEYLYHFERSQ